MQRTCNFLLLLSILSPGVMSAQTTQFIQPAAFSQVDALAPVIAETILSPGAAPVNPAWMARTSKSEALASYHPLGEDFFDYDLQLAVVQPKLKACAGFGLISGNGHVRSAPDYAWLNKTIKDRALYFTLAAKLNALLSLGGTVRYVASEWSGEKVHAQAFDLGMALQTGLLAPEGNRDDGLCLDMSLLNLGGDIAYSAGEPVPVIAGGTTMVRDNIYRSLSQQLRAGFVLTPHAGTNSKIKLAIHAVHPNDSPEEIQAGLGVNHKLNRGGALYLQTGAKALLDDETSYKGIIGAGVLKPVTSSHTLRLEYALSNVHTVRMGLQF